MKYNPVWIETYNGYGIYKHSRYGYGDETKLVSRTLQGMRDAIDTHNQQLIDERAANPELAYWDSLTHVERQQWRRLSANTDMSAPAFAYANKTHQLG